MSLTEKTYARFWATMGERYGSRWLDTYGAAPTHAWRETLSAFSPQDIQRAIDMLADREETKQHPPTEPGFKALLQMAVRKGAKQVEDALELRRGYWRSSIVHAVATGLGYTVETFEPVLIANKATLGQSMRDLLDDVDNLEAATGQRTQGQETHCAQRCYEIIVAFRFLKAKSPTQVAA